MTKKYCIFSVLFLPILLSLSIVRVLAVDPPEVKARHAALIDAQYGDILYEKDAYDPAAPASITKVMTALLICEALDRGDLEEGQWITASETYQAGLHPNGSTANIQPGEVMTVKDLMYCLLLPSANEAANILGEAVSGDVPSFIALMNQRAEELGCTGTHFTNAHGLDEDGHYTTAHDICIFTREAMRHELFREIVSSEAYTVAETNLSSARTFHNTNALISNWSYTGYLYDKAIGVKTGTTENAGRCLVSAAEDKGTGEYLICVVLGAENERREDGSRNLRHFSESRDLLRWGFQNFHRVTLTQADVPVAQVPVTLSSEADSVMVKPVGEIARTLPVDMDLNEITTDITLEETVEAPIEEGQVLGSMTLSYNGEIYGNLDLVAVNPVSRSEFLYRQARIRAFFSNNIVRLAVAALLLVAAFVILRISISHGAYHPTRAAGRKNKYSGRRRR